MAAPLLMVLLLTGPWLVATGRGLAPERRDHAGRVGIMALFVFTGASHFTAADSILALIPPSWPLRLEAVYASGAIEIVLGLAALSVAQRGRAGVALLLLLIGLVPLNVYGAFNRVDSGGHAWGPIYLLVRLPLQAFIMWWVLRFALAPDRGSSE